jgi:hypothetical protein
MDSERRMGKMRTKKLYYLYFDQISFYHSLKSWNDDGLSLYQAWGIYQWEKHCSHKTCLNGTKWKIIGVDGTTWEI